MSGLLRPAYWWIWPPLVAAVLAIQLWFPDSGSGLSNDTYSTTATGYKAFYRLVEQNAFWTDRNTRPLSLAVQQGFLEPTLCILGPQRSPTPREWDDILDWVESGGTLLYGFRGAAEESIPRLDIRFVPRSDPSPPDDSLPPETKLVTSPHVAWWTDGRLVAPHATSIVEYNSTTQAVQGKLGNGRYVVCATSLVFSNQLLTYGDNPVLAMRLLETAGSLEGVTFDESLNTTGTPKAAGLIFERELRPLTLQLILLALLYAWWNCLRFGPFLRPAAGSRHNMADHTDALGAAYWRCHDGQHVVRVFVKLLLREVHLPLTGPLPPLPLQQLANRLQMEPATLAVRLEHQRSLLMSRTIPRREGAAVIRELAAWRQRLQNPAH